MSTAPPATADRDTVQDHWESRWTAGKTRFDQGQVHPTLVEFLQSEKGKKLVPQQGKAVVPGCGKGYDVHALASHGLDVVGIEIAPTAVKHAKDWVGKQDDPKGDVDIAHADWYEYAKHPETQKANVILEYTFLSAIHPEHRPKWKQSINDIAHPHEDTTLITLMFPLDVPEEHQEAHPFPLTVDLYHELLGDKWELVHLQEIDVEGGKGRKNDGPLGDPVGDEKLGVWKYKNA